MENQVATTNEIKKTKKRKNSNSQMLEWKKDGWKALVSLAPAMIILIIFTFYPIINTFVVSFFPNYNYITDNFGAFGFDSYIRVLTDADGFDGPCFCTIKYCYCFGYYCFIKFN